MKILFLTRSLDSGGAERQLLNLAVGLRDRGHDVAVATFYDGGLFAEEAAESGIRLLGLGKSGRWDIVGFAFRLRALIRSERPDILHTYVSLANVVGTLLAPRQAGYRLVWGLRASDMTGANYDWLTAVCYWLERKLARRADLIIANSDAARNFAVAHGMPAASMIVIPNGIDTHRFKPDAAARSRVRAALGIDDDASLIALPARFDPIKDHETFLAAAAKAARGHPGLHVLLFGRDAVPANAALSRLIEASGLQDKTSVLGERDDVPALLAAADLVVLSSLGEGFPNVLGEAMACGTPCVSSEVGDAAALLGDTGEVVPPANVDLLAAAIERMLGRLDTSAAEMRTAVRERIAGHFNNELLFDRAEKALGALIAPSDSSLVGQFDGTPG